MAHNIHEPIQQTSQPGRYAYEGLYKQFKMIIMFGVILVGASIAAIIMSTDPWRILIYSIPLTIFLIFLAFKMYPDPSLKQSYKLHFTLDEKGIYEEYINPETDEVEEQQSIPFSSINRVLIGNFVMEFNTHERFAKKYYQCSAIMVIEHKHGNYIKIFNHLEEFKDWLPRFLDKDCQVVKTEFNLAPTFFEVDQEDIDFSAITGETWQDNTVYPPIGEETRKNPFVSWEQNKKKRKGSSQESKKGNDQQKRHTRKWESRTMIALAMISFVVGGFILPFTPVDDNGALTLTYTLILLMAFMILYPVCLVYWRPHTRWYLPLLYVLITASIGTGSFLFLTLFINSPVSSVRVVQFFIFITVIGWIPAFILLKIIRGIIGVVWTEKT